MHGADKQSMKRPGKERQPSPPSLPEAVGISFLTSVVSVSFLVTWTQRNVGQPDRPRLSEAPVE